MLGRRAFLKVAGATPFMTKKAVEKLTVSQTVMGPLDHGGGNLEACSSSGIADADRAEAIAWMKINGIPPALLERLRSGSKQTRGGVDVDIMSLVSVSPAAKQRMQSRRNYHKRIANVKRTFLEKRFSDLPIPTVFKNIWWQF